MSVLCDFSSSEGAPKPGNRWLVKGAPNFLLERCTHVKLGDGNVTKLTVGRSIDRRKDYRVGDDTTSWPLKIPINSNQAYILQKFHHKDEEDIANHPLLKDPSKYTEIESGLTLVGIVGSKIQYVPKGPLH
jgi:hypothetical protein